MNTVPPPERQDIKELVRAGDVYLDSYPFGGSTSLMEPLETGVPVVVQRGSQLRSAMASGIIRELGLDELIADDEAGFIRIAVELARDPELRRHRAEATTAAMNAGPRFKNSRLYSQRVAPLLKSMVLA